MGNELLNEFGNSNKKINSTLDMYSIDELVNLYMTYSHIKFFLEHDNMEEILNYLSSYIIKNISKLSFFEIINLYSILAVKEKDLRKQIESSRHMENSILSELENDYFIKQNAKSKGQNEEVYKANRNKDLENCKEYTIILTLIYSLVNVFKNDLFSYLNIYICSNNVDKDLLIQQINKAVEENSVKIIEGIELRQNKKRIALHSKFKDVKEMSEVYEKMDTTKLEEQNNVYINYIDVLKHLSNGNSK